MKLFILSVKNFPLVIFTKIESYRVKVSNK